MARTVDAAEAARMIELHRAGLAPVDIAREVSRGPQAVREQLAAAGCIALTRPALSGARLRALICSYLVEGLSIRECAETYHLAGGAVRHALIFAGVTLRGRGGRRVRRPPAGAGPGERRPGAHRGGDG